MRLCQAASIPFALFAVSSVHAIWPLPSSYENGDGVLFIDQDVQISYNGANQGLQSYGNSQSNSTDWSSRIVTNAVQRTYDTLFNKNFVPWMFNPRFSNFEPSSDGATYIKSITLQQNAADPPGIERPEIGSVDESYTLDVPTSGDVTISAETSIGLMHGLTTFTQLFFKHSQGGVYTKLAPVKIDDQPKFAWRGLNLDTSRTFKPLKQIYAQIEALSYNKFNVLHWHITDAQSWPLEIPAMPELADQGAYTADQKYSAEDVKAVQDYGALHGITVAMEIDMPGHTSSIFFSHPELVTAFNVQPDWTTYCAEPPCGSLKLNSSDVSAFLDKLLDDLLPRLQPYTTYFHLGGDEVNANAYNLDETVQTNDTAIIASLIQRFMDRNIAQLREYNLTPLVWEEMLLQWNLTLPDDTIVQTWQSDEAVAQTVSKGHKALVGNYNYWYLDCGRGQWLDFYPEEASEQFWPYNDYCAPVHNWRVVYGYDPLHDVPENLTHLVLGGEVHTWSEQIDAVNYDSIIWPRAAAAAEVLWSGAKDAAGNNRSQIEASPRLSEMRERLVARGIGASIVQMPFCTMNGTQCAYPPAT